MVRRAAAGRRRLHRGPLTDLAVTAARRRFRRGEVVFHEGDPGDTVHLVDKGHVAVRVTTPVGDVATVRVVGPGCRAEPRWRVRRPLSDVASVPASGRGSG
ncbi:MAG: cyclic nucleotide-binding domain-containing protein [Desertimonas sp.]